MSDNQKSSNVEVKSTATQPDAQAPQQTQKAAAPAPVFQAAAVQQPQQTEVRMQLFNSSGATLTVPVFNKATGESDMVFVQHGGKPKLLPGYIVDPIFASRNPALQSQKVTD